jgi:hypothetical protein
MHKSRRDLALFSVAALLPAAASEAPVTLVVPFSPGGSADLAARALVAHLPALLPGQPMIQVEYRAGASGAVGTASVARAAPDGQTLLLARVGSSAILPATDSRTPFAWDEFTFLGLLEQSAYRAPHGEALWLGDGPPKFPDLLGNNARKGRSGSRSDGDASAGSCRFRHDGALLHRGSG